MRQESGGVDEKEDRRKVQQPFLPAFSLINFLYKKIFFARFLSFAFETRSHYAVPVLS